MMSKLSVSKAEEGDLGSLATIVPRSFHPVNSLFFRLFPDTPQIREWWRTIFASARAEPEGHVLTAIDDNVQDGANRVVGVLCMQRCSGPDDRGAEFWTKHGITPDHDADLFAATMAPMFGPRARLMQGRQHYLVQLFGVDHAYQGKGIGKILLQRACDIADHGCVDMSKRIWVPHRSILRLGSN